MQTLEKSYVVRVISGDTVVELQPHAGWCSWNGFPSENELLLVMCYSGKTQIKKCYHSNVSG